MKKLRSINAIGLPACRPPAHRRFLAASDAQQGDYAHARSIIELRYLIYVAILMASMWVPYILAHIARSARQDFGPFRDGGMPVWAARLKRAHYNLVEKHSAVAIAVLAGEVRNVHTATTAASAAIFFSARVAYPIATVANV
jgi:uncharacterized MAPEG superfamily protein